MKLKRIEDSDRIYVLDDGKIIEIGNHDELMNDKGQYYKL